MIWKIVLVIFIGGIVAAAVARARVRARQPPAADVPELNKHPERLEQSLDETDDA